MANETTPSVPNPVGNDGPGGQELDVKNYVTFQVGSTKHNFTAPTDKYKDIAKDLGLENVEEDAKKKGAGIKLAQGTGFIYIMASFKGGGALRLACDPTKLGTALTSLPGKKSYGKEIERVYIPRRRVYI